MFGNPLIMEDARANSKTWTPPPGGVPCESVFTAAAVPTSWAFVDRAKKGPLASNTAKNNMKFGFIRGCITRPLKTDRRTHCDGKVPDGIAGDI